MTNHPATYTYEKEFERASVIVKGMLWESLKKYPITLIEFDSLVNSLSGVIAQHYREGAYHGDIDARTEIV